MSQKFFVILLISLVFVIFSSSFGLCLGVSQAKHFSPPVGNFFQRSLSKIFQSWQAFHQRVKIWWENAVVFKIQHFLTEQFQSNKPVIEERFKTQKKNLITELRIQFRRLWDSIKRMTTSLFSF